MATSPTPKTVAILEARTGAHLAELISRQGAVPLLAPALEEVPDVDPAAVAALLEDWIAHPFRMMIFQTGVGTRALFQVTDSLGSTPVLLDLLEKATVVVRGPKPTGELNARGVRIDIRAASPFTSETVLLAIAACSVEGARVVVQRYGEANRPLCEALDGPRRLGAGDRDLSLGAAHGLGPSRTADRCARALGAWMRWCSRARCK